MLPSTRYGAFTLAILFAACALVRAEPEALWFAPSPNWHVCPPARSAAVCKGCPLPLTWEFRYGIDGNWSAFTIYVGEPAQPVDVAVSTALSEIWVIGESGCGPSTCLPPPVRLTRVYVDVDGCGLLTGGPVPQALSVGLRVAKSLISAHPRAGRPSACGDWRCNTFKAMASMPWTRSSSPIAQET